MLALVYTHSLIKKILNAVALRERDLGNENLNKAILKI